MNIDYIKEFLELARCLNYSEAAANLHVHQSTLSKHILSLEKEFHATFLDRNSTGVRLTEQGYCFVGNARKIMDLYEDTKRQIADIQNSEAIYISWELVDGDAAGLISLATILNNDMNNPAVKARHFSGELLDCLIDEKIDVLIKTEDSEVLAEHDLKSIQLLSNPFVAIVEKENPLAAKSELHIADLRNETLIQLLSDDARAGWQVIESTCRKNGFEPITRPVLTQSFPEQFTIPLNGCVLLFPAKEREVKFLSKIERYACIPIADKDAFFPLYCIFKPEKEELLRGFLSALDQALALSADN